MSAAPTERFSDRVANYVRYRPDYPDALLDALRDEVGWGPMSTLADLGTGTGISAALLLRLGAAVIGVEPNAEMRVAAETALGGNHRFRSVNATAEATTLPDASVDGIAAAQAFHWFDVDRTRRECKRILRPGGRIALFWNNRRTDATPFLRDYEALLQRYGTDYREVSARYADPAALHRFFGGLYERRTFPHAQTFDFEALRGRLLSSSYAPPPGHPGHAPMLEALAEVYDTHQEDGGVHVHYDTELFFGVLSSSFPR